MAKANSTRTTGSTEKPTVQSTIIHNDNFDSAMLKLGGAINIIKTIQIFIGDAAEAENGECISVAPRVLAEALMGIGLLLDGAMDELVSPMAEVNHG